MSKGRHFHHRRDLAKGPNSQAPDAAWPRKPEPKRRTYQPDRTKFPRSTKAREAFANERGWTCECGCGGAIIPGVTAFEIHHVLPREFGGGDEWENLSLLIAKCHRSEQTPRDIKAIAKSNRVRAKHLGTWAPSRNPLPGGRKSGWKKKLRGRFVRREA